MKRTVILIVAAICLLGLLTYFFTAKKKIEHLEWHTAIAEKGSIELDVTATGTVQAVTSVLVGTQVSGTVCKLFADYNDRVKAGQLIAMIDTSFLSASLQDAVAAQQKAQVQTDQSKLEYDRIAELYKNKVAAQADYDQALSSYQSNKSLLISALAQVKRARINLDYAKIRSPIDGIIISRNVDIGQTVAASFNTPTLFTVANDLTKMQINAYIDETDIGHIDTGQTVWFTVEAYPGLKFRGEITQVRLQPIVIQNVVNYSAIINTSNPDLKLKPGMTANITVNVSSRHDIIKIPSVALRYVPSADVAGLLAAPDSSRNKDAFLIYNMAKSGNAGAELLSKAESLNPGDTCYVWLKQLDHLLPQKVVIGISDGTNTEISSGVNTGDEIVLSVLKNVKTEDARQNPFMPKMPGAHKKQ